MATDPHDASAPAQPVFVVVRGEMQVNEIKVRNHLHGVELRPMTDVEARAYGIVPGYTSPIGIDARVRVIADRAVAHDRFGASHQPRRGRGKRPLGHRDREPSDGRSHRIRLRRIGLVPYTDLDRCRRHGQSIDFSA